MGKHFIRVILLMIVIIGVVVGSIHYRDYITEPFYDLSVFHNMKVTEDLDTLYDKEMPPQDMAPLDDNDIAFKNLAKAVMDKQGNTYVIDNSKKTIQKFDASGTLVYVINSEYIDEREYNSFSDLAVDSKGNLYVLEHVMDINGFLIKQEKLLRYTADGKLDPTWQPYKRTYESAKTQPRRIGVIRSPQVKDDLLYFFTYESGVLELHRSDGQGKQASIYKVQLPSDHYVTEIKGTDPSAIVYTTKKGELYKVNGGLLYPQSQQAAAGSKLFPESISLDSNNQNVYFIDEYGESIKKLSLQTPSVVEKQLTDQVAGQGLSDTGPMTSLSVSPSGTLVIGINDRVVQVTPQNAVEPLHYSHVMHVYQWIYWAGLIAALISALLMLKIIIFDILPSSLFWKQLLIPVPLIILALLGSSLYLICDQFSNEVTQEVDRGLIFVAHDGQNLIDGSALARITTPKDYMNTDYQTLFNKLTFVDHFGKFYSTVYKYENNHLYSIIDDDYKMFEESDVDSLDEGMTCQDRDENGVWYDVSDLKKVVTNGDVVTCSSSDANGKWLYAMGPLYSADKSKIIGVYETGINRSAFDYRITDMFKTGLEFIGYLLIALVFVFLLITWFMFRPIDRLRVSAGEIAAGHYDAEVKIRSHDEVGKLGQSFNQMSKNIRKFIWEVTTLGESYKRFVPQQLMELLGKDSILDVKLGDQTEKPMSVLVTNIRHFHDLSQEMTPEENFNFMNRFLQYISPAVRDNHGLINKYLGSGVLALFPEQPLQALQASIAMRKALDEYNASRTGKGKKPIDIGIGITQGPMILGIIGEGERLEGTVLSDGVTLATVLEELSETLGATVLIPSDLMRTLAGQAAIEYRSLGLVQLAGQKSPLELCDVYAADSAESRQLKAQTKSLFEQAIVLYQQGSFESAREAFLQVINLNQDDKIAKLYFFKCDEFAQTGTSNDWPGTLDVS